MADFHQPVLLPTLHHLADSPLEEREAVLERAAKKRPIALVIPALYSELEGKALPRMLKELAGARYVQRVVFSMNGMNATQYRKALRFFKTRLPEVEHTVLWNDGPELESLHRTVDAISGGRHTHGKGSNVWMGSAFLFATGHKGTIACHDSDILNYDREMLWRLCLPVTHPEMNYVFAKSFYGRVSDRMYGRVTRLLVFPLIQALRELFGTTPLLSFLAMFRYPLSGEFSADAEFLAQMGVSSDWGLEIGMLCDVFRLGPSQRVCQVDLGGNFDHKHQHVGIDPATGRENAKSGLVRMAREVTRTLLARLWNELGFTAEAAKLHRLHLTYQHTAKTLLARYKHDAIFNGLADASSDEKTLADIFGHMIEEVVSDQNMPPRPSEAWMPAWNDLEKAAPGFGRNLTDCVGG